MWFQGSFHQGIAQAFKVTVKTGTRQSSEKPWSAERNQPNQEQKEPLEPLAHLEEQLAPLDTVLFKLWKL